MNPDNTHGASAVHMASNISKSATTSKHPHVFICCIHLSCLAMLKASLKRPHNPKALRPHISRLLGPKTMLYEAFGLF